MVEVYKTDVTNMEMAVSIIHRLLIVFPLHRINFDLHDCDNILRVEGESICNDTIIAIVNALGYKCDVLE
jgi:hypothetical protein